MLLLQVGNFEEFANWFFIIVFTGFTMLFWRWLSGILRELQARAERTGEIVRKLEIRQERTDIRMEEMNKDLNQMRQSMERQEERMIRLMKRGDSHPAGRMSGAEEEG